MSYDQRKRNLELNLFKLKAAEIKQKAAEIDRTLQAAIQAGDPSSLPAELSSSREISADVARGNAVQQDLVVEPALQRSLSDAELRG